MALDDTQLRDTLRSLQAQLSAADASAIIDVARLAASADGTTDPDEVAMVDQLSKILYELAGSADVPPPAPTIDVARLLDIGNQLEDTGKRELAYACAMAVMCADRRMTTEESGLDTRLAGALLLEDARAREIAARIRSAVGAAS